MADWLGQPEGAELEYKAAAALRSPETIARAVVALLNAGRGGCVVVGVDDSGAVQGVERASAERDRLQQALLDRVEPRAFAVDVVDVEASGRRVLEVRVPPNPEGELYAEKHKGRMGFWWRSGAVTVPLRSDEIRRRLAGHAITPPTHWKDDLHGDEPVYVLLAATTGPAPALSWRDLERVVGAADRVQYRLHGWDVLRGARYGDQRRAHDALELGDRSGDAWLRLGRDGSARFEGRADFLRWRSPFGEDASVLYPYALVEGAATFVRLLGVLAELCELRGGVTLEGGLIGARGWRLGPYGPETISWQDRALAERLWAPAHADQLLDAGSHRAPWEQLRGAVDTAAEAWPLVLGLYEGFGYDEEQVPFWQPCPGRFVIV